MNRHPKAARTASIEGGSSSRPASLTLVSLVALLALVFVPSADAAHFQRPFKETFGSAAQPSFEWSTTVAVEQDSGNVLVGDYFAGTITRYHADGTPAPFTALGGNAIDGKEANGKPCAEEPASCDRTPENEVRVGSPESFSIAIDESGGPTDGDIYMTPSFTSVVDIFAPDGKYLGQLTGPSLEDHFGGVCGVAVDAAGAVYVSSGGKINKFVPTANPVMNTSFVSAFGPDAGDGICAIAVGHGPTAGSIFGINNGGNAGYHAYQFDKGTGELKYTFAREQTGIGGVAVDPNTGTVLLPSGANGKEVMEFEAPGGSEPVRISRLLADSNVEGFAVNSSSEVVLSEGFGGPHLGIFGTPGIVPTLTLDPASNIIGTKATLTGTVNPTGVPVTECYFEYEGIQVPCEGSIPTDSSPHQVHANLSGLEPNGHTYSFRLVAVNANGTEESESQTFVTVDTVVTEAATAIGATTATLNGTVRPEGSEYSECFFEYGLSTSASYEKTAPCNPSGAGIAPDFLPHAVKAALTGLQAGAIYRYRLVATNSFGTLKGEELTLSTFGLPRISIVRASNADQGSAMLEATINPSGFGTSYRFEWGPTNSYGNFVPADFEPFIGSGTEPVLVKARISGLSAGAVYHYRVVASNSRGTTQSPDQVVETLNSCGLPEGRCFELVSRRDAGPVAIPGEEIASAEMHYQAKTSGSGLAYPVEAGYPDSTKGAEVLYRAFRGPGEWESTQLSAPISGLNEQGGAESGNGPFEFLSNDLSCGFLVSNQLLTADPGTRLMREYGGSNIYRRNPDGSYTAVTKLAPENPEAEGSSYGIAYASQDCSKVVFLTSLRYPGVPGEGAQGGQHLYEWEEGTLRSVAAGAQAGTGTGRLADSQNLVSEDGSRVFFVAQGQIFVRENGTTTRELSQSETSTPNTGSTYQWATPDGSVVFFLANAGLTAETSSEGTDLYKYDLETEKLTDVSVGHDAGGAQVAGFVAASLDGSHVYFAARAQLIPGRGNTLAQNEAEGTFSIYSEHDGEYGYVGKVSDDTSTLRRVVVAFQGEWSSQTTPDGRYLLFESTSNITGYESGDTEEAYLYDSKAGSEATICVSCRQDGQPSVAPNGEGEFPTYNVLPTSEAINNPLHPARYLAQREGKPLVFFSSPDALAPGAVEHQNNVYEWSHGQIFRLTSAERGQQSPLPFGGYFAALGGVSDDASDVYFVTPETLNWEDGDKRLSAYDARIGGGFAEPPATPAPCVATTEGSCQGPGQGGTAVPGAASATFNGPGNPKQAQPHKKKKAHKKKSKKHAKKKGGGKKARHANGNRRAGK